MGTPVTNPPAFVAAPVWTLGALLAVLVLIAATGLAVVGQLDVREAALFDGLALAKLL